MGTDEEVLKIGKKLDRICQKKEVCFVCGLFFVLNDFILFFFVFLSLKSLISQQCNNQFFVALIN